MVVHLRKGSRRKPTQQNNEEEPRERIKPSSASYLQKTLFHIVARPANSAFLLFSLLFHFHPLESRQVCTEGHQHLSPQVMAVS